MKYKNPSGRDRHRWCEALLASTLKSAEKVLGVRLFMHCNDETGRCNPGEEKLAEGTGYSQRYVRGVKATLRAAGWIAYDDNAGGVTNQYELVMDHVPIEGATRSDRSESEARAKLSDVTKRGTPGTPAQIHPEQLRRQPGAIAPPNTNHNNNSNNNGGAEEEETREREGLWTNAQSLLTAMARASGLPSDNRRWPRHWKGPAALEIVQGYIDRYGQFEEAMRKHGHEVIIPLVEAAMQTKRDGPPNSPKFFEQPLARAHAPFVDNAPPPPPPKPLADVSPRKPTAVDHARLAERLGLGAVGFELACQLSEIESEQMIGRMLEGELSDEELHQIRLDLESRAALEQPPATRNYSSG